MEVLSEKYNSYLLSVRKNALAFIPELRFEKDYERNKKHTINRLRLAAALFNDLQPGDYTTIRFLFGQELKAMRWNPDNDNDEQFYNLRLIALLLSRYKNPEDIWMLFEAHTLDGNLDIEYVLAIGIDSVFNYLKTSRNKKKVSLLRKVGSSAAKSKYKQTAITTWIEEQEEFMDMFLFPVQDEIHFALVTQEPERIKDLLPQWIKQQKEWTADITVQYIGLARNASDTDAEIHALKMYTSTYDDSLTLWFQYRLAELYVSNGNPCESVALLNDLLFETDDKELIEACINKLCEVVGIWDREHDASKKAVILIHKLKKEYKRMPASLKAVIDRTVKLYDSPAG